MARKSRGTPSEETKHKISESQKGKPHPNQRGENHGSWKGDNISYIGIHAYLGKWYKQLKIKCEHCDKRERLQFAKKHGREYTRNIEDYLILCQWCHLKYDGNLVKGLKTWNKGNVATYPKVCPGCTKDFMAKKKRGKFCSLKCAAKSRFSNDCALNPKKV